MLGKYITYYRLKNNMTQEELAPLLQMSPETIAQYESGSAVPPFAVLERIAETLDADICDFLAYRNEHLTFLHGPVEQDSGLTDMQQDFIRLSVEEYLNRFYIIVEIMGEDALPAMPVCHGIPLSADAEKDAKALRAYLHIPGDGPIQDLVRTLEDHGILVCFLDIEDAGFSGRNGLVNSRPYIAVNGNMPPECIRSAVAREAARIVFDWPDDLNGEKGEEQAAAISEAFLFPRGDGQQEPESRLGAASDGAERSRPAGIEREEPQLFERLVTRAVTEYEITIEKGAELLKQSYVYVAGLAAEPVVWQE